MLLNPSLIPASWNILCRADPKGCFLCIANVIVSMFNTCDAADLSDEGVGWSVWPMPHAMQKWILLVNWERKLLVHTGTFTMWSLNPLTACKSKQQISCSNGESNFPIRSQAEPAYGWETGDDTLPLMGILVFFLLALCQVKVFPIPATGNLPYAL